MHMLHHHHAYPGDLLEHLRAFVAVAGACERGRSPFGPAAAELALDTSVLRRRLGTLASFVGAPLFVGRGSGTRLTAAGKRTRENALRALEAVRDLSAAAEADRGPLRIACTGTILGDLLPPVLAAMQKRHPALLFRVRRAGATAAAMLLERGEVDFAVVRASSSPGKTATRIAGDRVWLAVHEKSALARARLDRARVAREPLVGYGAGSTTMARVLDVLGPLGATAFIEVDGKAPALRYVEAGLGVAFVSALADRAPKAPGVVFREVTSWFAPVSFWLVEGEVPRHGWRTTFVELLLARRLR